ncbi:MAG: class I SAM-dependent methyltransferase [Terricaulis sp.]
MSDANAEAIEAWNTFLFDKFSKFRDVVVTGLSIHGDACLDRHPPPVGALVLDVGCGFGDTTQQIAKLVGANGEAVGVDAAPRFIDLCINEAREAEVKNARFIAADVESAPLGGPYDYVFSRFGVMFFANPVAALRNIRKSLKPGGRFAAVVWRRKDENPWLYDAEQRALKIVPRPEETEDQITCGPGPFSMSGADLVSTQMQAAGFTNVSFERFDCDINLGATVDRAVETAMALGPAGELLRLAGDDAERKRPQVEATLRDLFTSWRRDGGVCGRSSSWILSGVA